MATCNPSQTPMNSKTSLVKNGQTLSSISKTTYQAFVGSMIWASICTRPDLAVVAGILGQFSADPKEEHWTAAKSVLRYIAGSLRKGIILGGFGKPELLVFSDSTWESPRSRTGYVCDYGGPISWGSIKQETTALSSTKAEYMALCEAARETVYLRTLIFKLEFGNFDLKIPSIIFCDNIGAKALASNPLHHRHTKHIPLRYHYIRYQIDGNTIVIHSIPSKFNPADAFTKPLDKVKFDQLVEMAGLINI